MFVNYTQCFWLYNTFSWEIMVIIASYKGLLLCNYIKTDRNYYKIVKYNGVSKTMQIVGT